MKNASHILSTDTVSLLCEHADVFGGHFPLVSLHQQELQILLVLIESKTLIFQQKLASVFHLLRDLPTVQSWFYCVILLQAFFQEILW